jgi:formate dehydrogenase subunit delta
MANQIGKFFAHQGDDRAVVSIADHLRRYWDPRMRSTIVAEYDAVKGRLDPLVQRAVEQLRQTGLS